ncbi:hypothetical protein ACFL47_10185 [Candidatus Latescibacterota bacterium]
MIPRKAGVTLCLIMVLFLYGLVTQDVCAQDTDTTNTDDAATEGTEETSKKPPLPEPKTAITTEKPIKGALRGLTGDVVGAAAVDEDEKGAEDGTGRRSSRRSSRKPKKKLSPLVREEISLFNVSTDNIHTVKTIIDDDFNLRGMVYGEEKGFIRLFEADEDGNFNEVWKSPPLSGPVRELFVDDIDKDGETEIIAYTSQGNIFIYGYQSHAMEYRTPENTYEGISCMIVADLDSDEQLELFFLASQPGMPGRLIQFDPKSQFEEWTSTREFQATDMVAGNVDADSDIEIILNSGEILSSSFKNVKWECDIPLGDRLYLIDLDSDGMLELISEYEQTYVRIIEVDERRERW